MPSSGTRDQFLALLADVGGPVCDDCASERTGIHPRQRINGLAGRMAAEVTITRADGACAICSRGKLTSTLPAGAEGGSQPLRRWPPVRAVSTTAVTTPTNTGAFTSNDQYGKAVLTLAAGPAFQTGVRDCRVSFPAGSADLDGVVGCDVAVEIEARNGKQVRGALIDLFMHPYPKKLLVLIPSGNLNTETAAVQCEYILCQLRLPPALFRVVVLEGTRERPQLAADAGRVRDALAELNA
jgi:hypothetical protein